MRRSAAGAVGLAVALAIALFASRARAAEPAQSPPTPAAATPAPVVVRPPSAWSRVVGVEDLPTFLLFAGGALSSLTLHEMGHVTTNLAYGNVPAVTGIFYAKFIPWFVIDARLTAVKGVYTKHDGGEFGAGAHGYYVINTAGFMVQNIGSEIILTSHPRLVEEHNPLLKGMLWMNILLSLGYSTASLLGVEDPHGDIYGASRHSGYPSQAIAGVVFANGALDLLRYLLPDNTWLPWLSRATKVGLFAMDRPWEY